MRENSFNVIYDHSASSSDVYVYHLVRVISGRIEGCFEYNVAEAKCRFYTVSPKSYFGYGEQDEIEDKRRNIQKQLSEC